MVVFVLVYLPMASLLSAEPIYYLLEKHYVYPKLLLSLR